MLKFKKLDKEKDKKVNLKEKREQAEKAIKQGMNEAQALLKLPEFKKYRASYEEAQKLTIEYLISYRNSEPIQYAFHVQDFTNDLRSLGTLLVEVKKQAHE